MKRNSFSYVASLTAAVLLVVLCSFLQERMNAVRVNKRLTDIDPLENAPPLVAFTGVALGGFRGLAADLLWLRMSRLQDENQYFEMVQLADWILKLQPRNTDACAFLGWNMSYNISVTFNQVEDRWRWVKRGFELIRDEGLALNPGDPELFRQLGWIYQHKMGQDLDDANRYYKAEFAKEMIRLFADYYGRWQDLANAPSNEDQLRAALNGNTVLWESMARNQLADFDALEKDFRERAVLHPAIKKDLDAVGLTHVVEICLRVRWMTQKYRLEPEWILRLNQKYGAMDWRMPQTHAVYWAERGRAQWSAAKYATKRLSCDRMIFQSLAQAFQGGRLVYVKSGNQRENGLESYEYLEMTPNIQLVDAVDQKYRDALAEYPDDPAVPVAYGNFLTDAIVELYKFGARKKAAAYLKKAAGYKEYGDRFTRRSLEDFVAENLAEDMESASYNHAQGTVQAYLGQSYVYLAIGEEEQAAFCASMARHFHKEYAKFTEGTERRRMLPPFEQMAKTALMLVRDRMQPELRKALDERIPPSGDEKEVFIPKAEEIDTPDVK